MNFLGCQLVSFGIEWLVWMEMKVKTFIHRYPWVENELNDWVEKIWYPQVRRHDFTPLVESQVRCGVRRAFETNFWAKPCFTFYSFFSTPSPLSSCNTNTTRSFLLRESAGSGESSSHGVHTYHREFHKGASHILVLYMDGTTDKINIQEHFWPCHHHIVLPFVFDKQSLFMLVAFVKKWILPPLLFLEEELAKKKIVDFQLLDDEDSILFSTSSTPTAEK